MTLTNAHDKFFKETFGQIAIAKDFLEHYLPPGILAEIDLDDLQPQKDSFMTAHLKERFSDLIFQTRLKQDDAYICFLFEHKSTPSRDIGIQLLGYMAEVWSAKLNKEKHQELPVILPIVIYNGARSWQPKGSLGELIQGFDGLPPDLKTFIPNFRYLLYDLKKLLPNALKGGSFIQATIRALTIVSNTDTRMIRQTLLEIGATLALIPEKDITARFFETIVIYVFATTDIETAALAELSTTLENVYPEGSEQIMTTMERLTQNGIKQGIEQGIGQGIKQGIEQGVEKGTKQATYCIARTALQKGMDVTFTAEITGLPLNEIRLLAKQLTNGNSPPMA